MFHYQSQTDLKHYLAICHIPQIGSKRLACLLNNFSSIDAIFGSNIKELMGLGFSQALAQAILKPGYKRAEQDLAWLEGASNRHILTLLDPEYPRQLQEIAAKPSVLYAQGCLGLLNTPQIAIVGSRNPSASGLMNTQVLTTQLSQCGYTITSGLALGIDAKAHQAALNVCGATIAVLGTGLNQIYPRRHEKLAAQISEQGLLISEFSVNTSAQAENFPRRNRIISGLSLGVLVIEAALKSGSLITARYAIEQNREVFAIPGAIHNPLAQGCHALIRQGAKLVETVTDIIEEFSGFTKRAMPQPALSAVEHIVLNLIDHTPLPFDYLIEQSKLGAQELTVALTQLEVLGLIQATPCGYIHFSEQPYESQCA
ncbi:MAG: DNA-processing protein DprA [Legionellales bacterium]|jgi:DNA processing protein